MRNSKGQFIKGNIPFTKGKPRTAEVRKKLSDANLGKKQTVETINKRVLKLIGKTRTDLQKQNISLSKIGKPNGHLGTKLSEETKKKISIGNKGKQRWTLEQRMQMSKDRKGTPSKMLGKKNPKVAGEKNFNWRGGVTTENEKIRKSTEYRLWREAVFKRDDYTCLECGIRGGELNADHIKPFAWFPELRFAIDNGRTLCKACHLKTDTWGKGSYKFKVSIRQ